MPGVVSLHDIHIWVLTSGETSLTAHVVLGTNASATEQVLSAIRATLAKVYGIGHITVQCELTPCEQAAWDHHYWPGATGSAGPSHRHCRSSQKTGLNPDLIGRLALLA